MAQAEAPAAGAGGARWAPLALAIAGLLLLLTFATGWFSVDLEVDTWTRNPSDFEGKGDPLLTYVFDLEMHMFRIETNTKPVLFEDRIKEAGEPTYQEHAGRTGTVLFGVFLLQVSTLLTFVAFAAFYAAYRKGKADESTVRRVGILYVMLSLFTLLYFVAQIGEAGQDDATFIVDRFQFTDEVSYDLTDMEIRFWWTWESDPERVVVQNQEQTWQATVKSRPSAGWWMQMGSALAVVGVALAQRFGQDSFGARPQEAAGGTKTAP